jgi:hypothetical protein
VIRVDFTIECDLCEQVGLTAGLKIINQSRRDQNQERAMQVAWDHGWGYFPGHNRTLWYCPVCVPRAQQQGVKVRLAPKEDTVDEASITARKGRAGM